MGLFIMAAWAVPCSVIERREWKLVAAAIAAVLLGFCAVLSRVQIRYWRNSETLFRHALDVTSGNWMAHNNLGVVLSHAGKFEEAIAHYQEALRIKPDYAEVHYNLWNALLGLGKAPEAIEHHEKALQIKRDFAKARDKLARPQAAQ